MWRNLVKLSYMRELRQPHYPHNHGSVQSCSNGTRASSAQPSAAVVETFTDMCEGLFRSSTYRERLLRSCHEPSPQVLKRCLDEFCVDPAVWANKAWTEQFTNATKLTTRAELCMERFLRWHLSRQAPRKVQMGAPWDWYPHARLTHRTFYYHYGPTNSGKTRAALQVLSQGRSGVYAAPLKALAGQVWRQMNEHMPCDLLIGDERRFSGDAEHVSCTVEMTPVDVPVEVGVIDEVQLIGDKDRGWAWTRALLGLPAREIHLCGEERAIPLVEKLLYKTHERKRLNLVEHRRLVPLESSPPLGGDLQKLENGDCLVCFSRKGVLGLQRRIEQSVPGARVSFIYGAMPFAVREHQAARFNEGVKASIDNGDQVAVDGDARHVLVATDAIAYGLNMNIERIVFTSLNRFDGTQMQPLPDALIKQVSGRAGRFGVRRRHAVGRFTSLHDADIATLTAAMKTDATPLHQAGLLPSSDVLQLFAEMRLTQHAKTKNENGAVDPTAPPTFASLVREFADECHPDSLFFACDITRSLLRVADVLESVADLSLPDRILFCYVPLSDTSDETLALLCAWAGDHARGGPVELRIDQHTQKLTSQHGSTNRRALEQRLQQWERLYRQSEIYCWLAWRFRTTFVHKDAGSRVKALCSDQITQINRLLERVH